MNKTRLMNLNQFLSECLIISLRNYHKIKFRKEEK